MRMMFLLLALLLPATAQALTPNAIPQSVCTLPVVTAKLDSDRTKAAANIVSQNCWDVLIQHVDQGAADWIALVPRLVPSADSELGEDLTEALATALPYNAVAVLKIVDLDMQAARTPLEVDVVCGIPFIGMSERAARAYYRRAQPKVAAVRDPLLVTARNACLHYLKTPIEYQE